MFMFTMVHGTLFPLPRIKAWRCWIIPFLAVLVQRSGAISPMRFMHWEGRVKSLRSSDARPNLYLHGREAVPSRHLITDYTRTEATFSQCQAERSVDDYYTAELQLFYVYAVEFGAHAKSRSLAGLEAVTTTAIIQSLTEFCDDLDRPMYKVLTTLRHQFSKDAFCAPHTEGNTCSVVNGATAILLDDRSSHIKDIVYAAIDNGLRDAELLAQFSPSVVQADFQAALGEALIMAPSPLDDTSSPGPITAAVAVAAASVSFILASFFCYGMMRRHIRHHPEPSVRYRFQRRPGIKPSVSTSLPHPRRRFKRLDELSHPSDEDDQDQDDEDIEEESHVEDFSSHNLPCITRSISDITSDSASFVSGVSWATSRLERIDEGEEEEDYEELPNRKRKRRKRKSPSSDRSCRSVELVGLDATFSPTDDDLGELAGCRYVPESYSGVSETVDHNFITSQLLSVMLEVDDLQVSLDEEDEEDAMLFASNHPLPTGSDSPCVQDTGHTSEHADPQRDLCERSRSSNDDRTLLLADDKHVVIPPIEHDVGRASSAKQDGIHGPPPDYSDFGPLATPSVVVENNENETENESTTTFCSCRELPSPMPEACTPIFLTPLVRSMAGSDRTDSPIDLEHVAIVNHSMDWEEGIPQEITLEKCDSMEPVRKYAYNGVLNVEDSDSMDRSRHTV